MRKGMLAVMFCLLLLRGSAQVVNDSCLSAIGIYHYKVISNGEEVGNGKLAVIK